MGLRLSIRRESVIIILLLISVLIERHKIIKCQRFSPWLIHVAVHRRAIWCLWTWWPFLSLNLILCDIRSLQRFCWCYLSNWCWFSFWDFITTHLIHLMLIIALSLVIDILHNISVWDCAISLIFLYSMSQLPHLLASFPRRLIRIFSCFWTALNVPHDTKYK